MSTRFIALTLALALPLAHAAPPPGHPTAEQAIGLLGVPDNTAVAAKDLPYSGIVLTARDSNAFTFIEVKESPTGASRWIAAPRVALNPGDHLRFDYGRLMNNFYSRKLGITFEAITFVNRAVRTEAPKP